MIILRLPPQLGQRLGASCGWGGVIILAEDDPRTLRHELEHLRQQAEDGLLLWTYRYATSPTWRLHYEALAWAAEQDPDGLEDFALDLSTRYRCGTLEDCRAALKAIQAA